MKALLAALLLAASFFSAAQAPQPSPQQVEGLVALARVYGVVRYFHPSDSLDLVPWDRFLVHAADRMGGVTSRGDIAPRLEELFAPIVDGFKVAAPGTPANAPQGDGPTVEWRHLGYGMETDASMPYASWRTHHIPVGAGNVKGGYFQHRAAAEQSAHTDPVMRVALAEGLEAQVPVSLPMSATKVDAAQKARLDALVKALESTQLAGELPTRAQAHADGIAAWNVARHFYPYWDVVKLDWEAALREWLPQQPQSQARVQLRDSLRRLTVALQDGHVGVADAKEATPRAFLDISVRPVGMQWVVDSSRALDKVQPGDVLTEVAGQPAARWFEQRLALISGSPQHKRWSAARELLSGAKGSTISLRLSRRGQSQLVNLAYHSPQLLQGPRPAPLSEVKPGVHYVDLSRFDKAAFDKALATLQAGKGIIFDLRGYPSRDAVDVVKYWLTGEDKAQWMFVPRYDKPYAQSSTAWSIGWQVGRNGKLERAAKVLLVDGRAISYAESLAAYFPAQKTGTVIGEATAGANGNVARATLPSGLSFFFSSMRVTRHDGTATLHRDGVVPDVAVSPTVEGLRAGRDELLEKAMAVVEGSTPK